MGPISPVKLCEKEMLKFYITSPKFSGINKEENVLPLSPLSPLEPSTPGRPLSPSMPREPASPLFPCLPVAP